MDKEIPKLNEDLGLRILDDLIAKDTRPMKICDPKFGTRKISELDVNQ